MAHSDATRAAVMGALLAGQATAEVCDRFDLPLRTVQRWRTLALDEAGQTDAIAPLLASHLTEALRTLRELAVMARDPTWFMAQEASGVAVFYGVVSDKCVRMLDAMNRLPAPSGNGDEP